MKELEKCTSFEIQRGKKWKGKGKGKKNGKGNEGKKGRKGKGTYISTR